MIGYLALFTVTSYFLLLGRQASAFDVTFHESGSRTAFSSYEESGVDLLLNKRDRNGLFSLRERNTVYAKELKRIFNVKEYLVSDAPTKHGPYLDSRKGKTKDGSTVVNKNTSKKRTTNDQTTIDETSRHVLDSRYVNLPLDALELLVEKSRCPPWNVQPGVVRSPWLPQQLVPIGVCPSRLRVVQDPGILWPRTLVAVECLCRESRCSRGGLHRCITVHAVVPVIRVDGRRSKMVAVGCVCAANVAVPTRQIPPPALALRK